MTERRVFRFAPSPNGLLHLGHAYSALLNFDLARACGGRFLLRIEDIDRARARPEFEAAIHEDLAWLGLSWPAPALRQSERFDDYAAALERLHALGLLYPCRCTRGDILRAVRGKENWPHDPDGAPHYSGACRGEPMPSILGEILRMGGTALRLDMAKAIELAGDGLSWRESRPPRLMAADPAQWGDVVLARKDTPASYHIAVVVDDAWQGVTDVVRGRDLFFATSLHRLLQRLLTLPEPCYLHHELILDPAGEKLAKSRSSKTLRALRAEGVSPGEVRAMVGLGRG